MQDFDFSQVHHYKFYGFIKNSLGWVIKVVYRIRLKGVENVPSEDSRYIVAINHTCALDPVFAAYSRKVPPMHFMAKAELYEKPAVAWIITHMYGFPVMRGKGDNTSIAYGQKIVEEGHVMALCPEGRRVKDKGGVPQEPRPGVAIIAHNAHADVLPAAICCDGPIRPFKKVTVVYGKLLTNAELGLDKEEVSREEISAAAQMVMDRITELWESERK